MSMKQPVKTQQVQLTATVVEAQQQSDIVGKKNTSYFNFIWRKQLEFIFTIFKPFKSMKVFEFDKLPESERQTPSWIGFKHN